MRKFILVLLAATMSVSLHAFGETPGKTTNDAKLTNSKKCLFPKSRKRAPAWICNAQADNLAVAAVGSFAKSAAGTEFMQQMAAADARALLARKLREPVQQRIADSADAASKNSADRDSALISKITDQQLQGTRVLKSVYGPRGTLYVLIGFDEAGVNNLHQSIAADYMKQKRQSD